MASTRRLMEKMAKQPVYLYNTFEEIFIRTEPGNKYFAKIPGKPEYKIDSTTNLFMETFFEGREVTSEEYKKGKLSADQ